MTDIVERLRTTSSVRSWADADEQRDEAADEIERLRAENGALRVALLRAKGSLANARMWLTPAWIRSAEELRRIEIIDSAIGKIDAALEAKFHTGNARTLAEDAL